ncbi:hypothetical protein A3E04_00370 [Candidatus Kuenenbacteria bacterium RIFCSPHIGHO2_12_FULL_42_14]|uniref:Uncharacterized protein n=2 Tax=Candidatus Kueneniibacteriota TaxID=1752740 RepID=A0A1F6GKT7_9BACT|nr:MAG: hypothetical protein A3H55_01645 [Candidatus Kuenenbacteria bacterium RIFCSPLOWO2_02_FULL_42_16]OGG98734.1 MAG: hypothetical protein A3E04_00370 [Candidatus Kuenenbacteria bacterium RIFCSPHIGHO2_12_FULL_42_14]
MKVRINMNVILQMLEGVFGHVAADWLFVKEKGADGKEATKLSPAIVRQLKEIRVSKNSGSKVDETWVEVALSQTLNGAQQLEFREWRRLCLSTDQQKDISYAFGLMYAECQKRFNDQDALTAVGVSMEALLKITDRNQRTAEIVSMGFALPADEYKNLWEKAEETEVGKKVLAAGEQAKQVLNEAQTGLNEWQEKLDQAKVEAKNNLNAKLTAWRNRS